MTYEEMVSLLSGKIDLNDKTVERFKKYAALLKEWNEKMNLTAITDEPEIVEKHFYDCLLPTSHDLLDDRLICDLGTGAGFPGLVWAIAYPKCVVTKSHECLRGQFPWRGSQYERAFRHRHR